jgi:hypothetical protein
MKLTRAQREILECCYDWSAPYEVTQRRRDKGRDVHTRQMASRLSGLHVCGLLEYGPSQDTYRLTDAGRAALSDDKETP